MRKLVEYLVRKRNPYFTLSNQMDNRMLIAFIYYTMMSALRACKYLLYGIYAKGMMVGEGVQLRYIHKIKIGKYLKIGNGVHLHALGQKGITLGNNVSIGDMSRVIVSTTLNNVGSHIAIGNNTGIGEYAYLGGGGGLDIGNECIIGQYFSCHPENHHFESTSKSIKDQGVYRKGISIGNDCWIGSKVTVLDGVKIGDHSVIAAGSVVTRSFGPYSVIGGVPARLLKSREYQSVSVPI
jgi:acetyltransferase-like isoleucine patch superfamily enzyme